MCAAVYVKPAAFSNPSPGCKMNDKRLMEMEVDGSLWNGGLQPEFTFSAAVLIS